MNAQARAVGQCFADITHTIDTKLNAISAHSSQVPKLDLESRPRSRAPMGRISGYQYAEAYGGAANADPKSALLAQGARVPGASARPTSMPAQ